MTRLATARRVALAAVCSILPAGLVHELFSFAFLIPLIRMSDAGCFTGAGCFGIAVVLFSYLMVAVPMSAVFALAGAVTARIRHRQAALSLLWLIVYLLFLISTASGYRSGFGTTWLWHEPFTELMAHPIVTPVTTLGGLWAFHQLLRRGSSRAI